MTSHFFARRSLINRLAERESDEHLSYWVRHDPIYLPRMAIPEPFMKTVVLRGLLKSSPILTKFGD